MQSVAAKEQQPSHPITRRRYMPLQQERVQRQKPGGTQAVVRSGALYIVPGAINFGLAKGAKFWVWFFFSGTQGARFSPWINNYLAVKCQILTLNFFQLALGCQIFQVLTKHWHSLLLSCVYAQSHKSRVTVLQCVTAPTYIIIRVPTYNVFKHVHTPS